MPPWAGRQNSGTCHFLLGNDFVVRMGWGIFYGLIQGNRSESTGIVNSPFLADELSNFNTHCPASGKRWSPSLPEFDRLDNPFRKEGFHA